MKPPPTVPDGIALGADSTNNSTGTPMSDETTETAESIDDAFRKVGDFMKAGDHRFKMDDLIDYAVEKNPRKSAKWHIELTYQTVDGIKNIVVPFDSDTEAYEAVKQLDELVESRAKDRF